MDVDTSDTIYAFSCQDINGVKRSLGDFKGKVVLIVNVASKCGFTPQYHGLEEIYKTYKERGLVVLGFPCNQFGGQEPGSASDIQQFCSRDFGVSFPLFAKIDVNGRNADPLYNFLKECAPGIFGTRSIKWNFTKFLVDRNGQVKERWSPKTKPEELCSAIEAMLDEPPLFS